MDSRGIRNANPGNIRHGDAWRGLATVQPDPDFCTFVAPVYGIRAMAKILLTYQSRGLATIAEMLRTWAPSIANDTAAYVADVSARVGMPADRPIVLAHAPATFRALLKAIIFHENGQQPYADNVITDALRLAGVQILEGT